MKPWFHFVKQPKYYCNLDAVREPHKESSIRRARPGQAGALANEDTNLIPADRFLNPKGKAPGSVWTVATEPLKTPAEYTDHFAAFPSEFPRRIIAGWAPAEGLVLDPFGGTGTTAAVAKALGRTGISSDLSGAYCRLAKWRTSGGGYAYLAGKALKSQ
jgi:DNA modification methylase